MEQIFQGCPIDGCIRSRTFPSEEQMTVLNLNMGASLIGLVGRPTIHGIRRKTGTQGQPSGVAASKLATSQRAAPDQVKPQGARVTLGGEWSESVQIRR